MKITTPTKRSINIFNKQWVNIINNYKGPHTLITYSYLEEASGRKCWYLYGICCNCNNPINMRKDVFFRSTRCDKCSRLDEHNYKDNRSKEVLYTIWHGMKARCYNETNNKYYRYGGRGIKISKEWRDNYPAFKAWAYNNGYIENTNINQYKHYLAIDRIDNNGDYSPNNCQWITVSENSTKKIGAYNV